MFPSSRTSPEIISKVWQIAGWGEVNEALPEYVRDCYQLLGKTKAFEMFIASSNPVISGF